MTAAYSYDVYGAVRSHRGTGNTEFTFKGEQNDPNGLEYLRARYYDPATGRFLGQDPLGHGYGYAAGNPVLFRDATGLSVAGACLRYSYEAWLPCFDTDAHSLSGDPWYESQLCRCEVVDDSTGLIYNDDSDPTNNIHIVIDPFTGDVFLDGLLKKTAKVAGTTLEVVSFAFDANAVLVTDAVTLAGCFGPATCVGGYLAGRLEALPLQEIATSAGLLGLLADCLADASECSRSYFEDIYTFCVQ